MKRHGLLLLSVVAMLAFLPGSAGASTFTIDQSNTGTDNFDQGTDNFAQTFTAGRYGPLEYIELYLGNATSVNVGVALWSTTGTASTAVPHANIDETAQTVTTGAGQWVRFNFDNDILIPGRVYAIVITPTAGAAVFGTSANAYTRGRALALDGGTWKPEQSVVPDGPADWSFKTEMGVAAPTPTPTRAPTHAPTLAPTATPTATPTAAPTGTPAALAAGSVAPSDSAAASLAVAAASGLGGGSAAGAASSGSGSGGSGDSMLLVIAAVVVILIGVIGYLLLRLRRSGAGSSAGGGRGQP
jgi:hypothetical protein